MPDKLLKMYRQMDERKDYANTIRMEKALVVKYLRLLPVFERVFREKCRPVLRARVCRQRASWWDLKGNCISTWFRTGRS